MHYLVQQSWKEAVTHLLEALRYDPDNFAANFGLACVYFYMDADKPPQQETMAKAVRYAQKAVELDPEDEDAKAILLGALAELNGIKPPE